jgi:hypothetical protein
MEEKLTDNEFTGDIFSVLKPEIEYDNMIAWELIKKELVEKIRKQKIETPEVQRFFILKIPSIQICNRV